MLTESVLTRLESARWFTRVGESVASPRCRNVISWEEAFCYCEDDISKWCRTEAGLRLYNHLATLNRERFRQWNEIALGFADPLQRFVAKALSVAGIPEFPAHAVTSLKSQLIGALMEEAYDDVLSVTLCREQAQLLVEGYFPCGWEVASAEDFPDKAVILVF